MDFPYSRIQDLESQIDDQKTINLQFQQFIKTITSKNRQLTIENKELKEENNRLVEKVNRGDDKIKRESNSQRNLNGTNSNVAVVDEENLRKEYNKLFDTNQGLIRSLRGYNELKNKTQEYERKYKQLSKDYDDLINESAIQLMNDPRIISKVNKDMEAKIKELETLNEQLQEKLVKANDQISFNFNNAEVRVKEERL